MSASNSVPYIVSLPGVDTGRSAKLVTLATLRPIVGVSAYDMNGLP
jgi:hypothetical protein